MKNNETILEMARQIIEDCNNHNLEQSFFPQEDEKLFTNFILCTVPTWAMPLDIIREWQDVSQEERIEDYLRENGIYDEEEYDEDDEEYNEWDFINDTTEMLTADNCRNSEFYIATMWEFDGDIQEFWIEGESDKELLKNIVENFKEYQEGLKEFKKRFA